MEKRSRIEERENVRRDTEGGEKVRDTGGFITLPEIRRVSTQTVWQTKPGRRSEINQQHPTPPLTFFLCARTIVDSQTYSKYPRHRFCALVKPRQHTANFGSVRNLERLLPRCDRMRVCPLLVLLCLLCAGRAQKFSALTVG